MIKIDKVTIVDYTALIGGNNGEEQLVMSASMGQGGYSRLLWHRISVDMGGGHRGWTLIHNNHLMERIQNLITEWCEGGIKAPPKEAASLMTDIARACARIKREWQID